MPGDAIELSDAVLPQLRDRGLIGPSYDRRRLRPRIAHIGVGGFHRAHLAVYCDLLARRGSDWGIRGIGLLQGDVAMADVLAAQDHLYTFTEKGPVDRRSSVIGSIIDFVLATDEGAAGAVDALADPQTAIVSMTVTEAGYDDTLRNRRTFDTIVAALERRRRRDVAGVAVMSCDNLPGNGDAARRCVLAAAARAVDSTGTADGELVGWIDAHCSFPNSMVDRITPVTTDVDRDHLLAEHGLVDRWPVVGEPFWQWVLEDDFSAGRPEFSDVGALYTDDVHAWELYKLRLLNAGHSAIAYLSALAGIEFVDEAMATPSIRAFLERLLHHEAVPSLTPIAEHPAADYANTVVERFANTGVRDQIARLCIDGTSKFPTFLMPTIATQLRSSGPVADAAMALAGWAHYLATVPESAQAPDALAERSRPLARAARKDPATFVDRATGFPDAIVASERFVAEFSLAHQTIAEYGALGALESSRRS